MKKLFLSIAFLISSFAVFAEGISHSGGTDSLGCHYDRQTGIYHCH